MQRYFTLACLGITLLLVAFLYADSADAASQTFNIKVGNQTAVCEADDNSMMAELIACMHAVIDLGARGQITTVVEGVSIWVINVCTLALIVTLIKIAFGAVKIQTELVVLIAKLVIILGICMNANLLIEWRKYTVDGAEAIANIMVKSLKGSVDGLTLNTTETASIQGNTGVECWEGFDTQTAGVWELFDCQIRKILMAPQGSKLPKPGVENPDCDARPDDCYSSDILMMGRIMAGLYFTGHQGAQVTFMVLSLIMAVVVTMLQTGMLAVVIDIGSVALVVLLVITAPLWPFEATKRIPVQVAQYLFLFYPLMFALMVASLVLFFAVFDGLGDRMQAIYKLAQELDNDPDAKHQITLWSFEAQMSERSAEYAKAAIRVNTQGLLDSPMHTGLAAGFEQTEGDGVRYKVTLSDNEIFAAGDGVISFVQLGPLGVNGAPPDRANAGEVHIEHDHDYKTVYKYIAEHDHRPDSLYTTMEVKKGDKLGTVRLDLSDFHFELWKDGQQENPFAFNLIEGARNEIWNALTGGDMGGGGAIDSASEDIIRDLVTAIGGKFIGDITAYYIDIPPESRKDFIETVLATFIMLWFMVGFIRQMPGWVYELVGKGIVTPVAEYTRAIPQLASAGMNALAKSSNVIPNQPKQQKAARP